MLNHSRPRADVKKWPAYFQDLGYEVVADRQGGPLRPGDRSTGSTTPATSSTTRTTASRRRSKWLEARKPGKPLCLLVGTNWPHVPWPKESAVDPDRLTLPADLGGYAGDPPGAGPLPRRGRQRRPRPRPGLRRGPEAPRQGRAVPVHRRPRVAVPVRQVELLRRRRPHPADRRLARADQAGVDVRRDGELDRPAADLPGGGRRQAPGGAQRAVVPRACSAGRRTSTATGCSSPTAATAT